MTDLTCHFLGQPLANPLMNASGVSCRTVAELDTLASSAAAAMVTKSCTLEARAGNPEPRYRSLPLGSINSMGLPNEGYRYYLDYAERFDHDSKLLFLSISGLTLDDNIEMIAAIREAVNPALLEVNLSCPNVPGKPQTGYDFQAMDDLLDEVDHSYKRPFGVKLPPYFDISHFDAAAEVLNRYPRLAFVTCINSVGNGLMIDPETESVVIKPKDGFGGLGGSYVLPTALANVNAFYRRCPDKQVIGCGGVQSGTEVFLHLLAGASLVQIGTTLYEEGPTVFDRVLGELSAIMASKGYASIDEFRGKLKTL